MKYIITVFWCSHSLLFSLNRGSFPGLKRLGREADQSKIFGMQLKNMISDTSAIQDVNVEQ
jgi:hypothetical protein